MKLKKIVRVLWYEDFKSTVNRTTSSLKIKSYRIKLKISTDTEIRSKEIPNNFFSEDIKQKNTIYIRRREKLKKKLQKQVLLYQQDGNSIMLNDTTNSYSQEYFGSFSNAHWTCFFPINHSQSHYSLFTQVITEIIFFIAANINNCFLVIIEFSLNSEKCIFYIVNSTHYLINQIIKRPIKLANPLNGSSSIEGSMAFFPINLVYRIIS